MGNAVELEGLPTIKASVINFARILEERIFISYLLSVYSERGGISIDQSCSREGKRNKCKKKEVRIAKSEEGWQWEKGKKK